MTKLATNHHPMWNGGLQIWHFSKSSSMKRLMSKLAEPTTKNNTQIDVVLAGFPWIIAGAYESYSSDHKPEPSPSNYCIKTTVRNSHTEKNCSKLVALYSILYLKVQNAAKLYYFRTKWKQFKKNISWIPKWRISIYKKLPYNFLYSAAFLTF